jgi:dCMP deaminase
MIMTRPTWHEYFVSITKQVATRSTCLRRKVGAIIVKDKRILTTGYNGAPKGVENCLEAGTCLREELGVPSGERHEICKGLHAEQNALLQAAYHGVSIKDSVIYCTTQPCIMCSKMIINAGIRKIYYLEDYPDPLSIGMLDEAGVEYIRLDY